MSFQQQTVSIPRGRFDTLPSLAGVYILKNQEDVPVYIGKATSIKSRVQAHLRPNFDDPIGLILENQIKSVDYIVTQSPIEALILENVLIKRFKPRYNIRLKDDKSYPYIKITNEPYPRVYVTRQMATDDGGRYFGPYGNVRAARRSVKYLRTLFPIRSCTLPLDGVKKFKACLDYNIGLCKAPCIFAVSRAEYQADVAKFQLFLEGKLVELSREMYQEMWDSAEKQDYEKAGKLRDEIRSLETTALKQRIVYVGQKRDKDVLSIAREGSTAAAISFHVREGKVIGRDKFMLEGASPSSKDPELLSAFIRQYYGAGGTAQSLNMPDEIVVPYELEDKEEIKLLLDSRTRATTASSRTSDSTREEEQQQEKNRTIKISSPSSHDHENKSLLKLAQENALLALKEGESKDELKKRERFRALKELKEILDLDRIPRRIECFDISDIQGKEAVGAMTVFINGFPDKNEYRKFRIKTVAGIDDYSMMREMIGRRFRRLLLSPPTSTATNSASSITAALAFTRSSKGGSSSGAKEARASGNAKFATPPNLVVIDGGRGHLNAALEQMHEDGIFGIPTISLAKKEEVIFVPKKAFPIRLGKDSEALHILQYIRDEAHRFGITYHRKLSRGRMNESLLDSIDGIGEKRKRDLLAHFGSVSGIRNSTVEEIAQAGSMSRKTAEVVLASLNKS